MDYINLGRTGLKVSRICLGAMSYGTPQWRSWVLNEEVNGWILWILMTPATVPSFGGGFLLWLRTVVSNSQSTSGRSGRSARASWSILLLRARS